MLLAAAECPAYDDKREITLDGWSTADDTSTDVVDAKVFVSDMPCHSRSAAVVVQPACSPAVTIVCKWKALYFNIDRV